VSGRSLGGVGFRLTVGAGRLADLGALHPTWTRLACPAQPVGVTRAGLVRYRVAVLGRRPAAMLPEMTDDDVRRAA
jgi:hypothetical protein